MRKIVKQFADEMERVLKENDYKGGWGIENCSIQYLEQRLIEEIGEYFGDIANNSFEPDELIDIANFCAMIWDRRTGNVHNS